MVGLVLKVGGLRVVGVEVLRRGGIGVWERCVEDVCGVGRWVVVVVVVGIEAFVEMSGLNNRITTPRESQFNDKDSR